MENYMNDYLTIALPKGKLFTISKNLLHRVGLSADHLSEKSRKLVIENKDLKVRFIIGKDVLLESQKDVYEILDLGFGKCHLMMAVPQKEKRRRLLDYSYTRVATKYPHIAESFFARQGMQMEYIKLNGSIELGPIVGLSESIVDIVETGTTLAENDLEEIAHILDVSARLIVNRVSFKLKFHRINEIVNNLRPIIESGEIL